MQFDLTGKRALVSGSTSGIGAATAKMLAGSGAEVVVHGRNAERAASVVDHILSAGGKAFSVLGDTCADAPVEQIRDAVMQKLGGIDILVNNLGNAAPFAANWFDATPDQWLDNYNLNVVGAVRLIHAFVPDMKERGWGRVINIASGAYVTPPVDFPAYGPAKAALVNLTVGLSKALDMSGVTVNTVSPGLVLSDALEAHLPVLAKEHGWPETDIMALAQRFVREMWPNPVGRIGLVDEIAALVTYLASQEAGYTNGANVRIDGGAANVPF